MTEQEKILQLINKINYCIQEDSIIEFLKTLVLQDYTTTELLTIVRTTYPLRPLLLDCWFVVLDDVCYELYYRGENYKLLLHGMPYEVDL